jgi:hypothetical protein
VWRCWSGFNIDDDGKGEVADVVAVRLLGDANAPSSIEAELYHCDGATQYELRGDLPVSDAGCDDDPARDARPQHPKRSSCPAQQIWQDATAG